MYSDPISLFSDRYWYKIAFKGTWLRAIDSHENSAARNPRNPWGITGRQVYYNTRYYFLKVWIREAHKADVSLIPNLWEILYNYVYIIYEFEMRWSAALFWLTESLEEIRFASNSARTSTPPDALLGVLRPLRRIPPSRRSHSPGGRRLRSHR